MPGRQFPGVVLQGDSLRIPFGLGGRGSTALPSGEKCRSFRAIGLPIADRDNDAADVDWGASQDGSRGYLTWLLYRYWQGIQMSNMSINTDSAEKPFG